MIERLKKMFNVFLRKDRKEKGFSLPEILVACSIIVSLSAAAFFGFNQAQQTRKMAQMHSDMEAIAAGCLAYEAMNINGLPPADLDALLTGLTADNSIDNEAHDRFVTSSKLAENGGGAATTLNDPWGQAYVVSGTDRTITCTPNDSSGSPLDAVVRRF